MELHNKELDLLKIAYDYGFVNHGNGKYIYRTKPYLVEAFKRLVGLQLLTIDYGKFKLTDKGRRLVEYKFPIKEKTELLESYGGISNEK